MIRSELQFMTSTEHFDRFFAYKVFGKIKRTTVKILSMEDIENIDSYLFYTKSSTKIGEGIHLYYSFSFSSEGKVLCAHSSSELEDGGATPVEIEPLLDEPN
jgi:hypothetical protein